MHPLAPPLLVGEPEIRAEIADRHHADIEAMTALGRVVTGMFGGSWTFQPRGVDRLVVYTVAGLLAKACKTFRSIQLLCERGFTADATALMRVLGETNVAVAFILQKRSRDRARIYHAFGIWQSIKMLNHWKQTPGLKRKATKAAFAGAYAGLQVWTKDLPPGTDYKSHWSGTGTLQNAMKALRSDIMYATLMRHTSQFVHVSDIGEHVKIENNHVVFHVVPTSEAVEGTSAVAREMLWMAANRIDQRLKLGYAGALALHRVKKPTTQNMSKEIP
jgi:hypothetical protein